MVFITIWPLSPSKPLDQTSEEEYGFQVNLKSLYWMTRYCLPHLIASRGSILNTASMAGLIGQQNHAAYVATKGAMIALTKAMALDYAPRVFASTQFAWECGRPCCGNGPKNSLHPATSGITSIAYIPWASVPKEMSLRMRPCSCSPAKRDSSPAAFSPSAAALNWVTASESETRCLDSDSAHNPRDARFNLQPGEGADAVHSNPVYSYAVTLLETTTGLVGTGLTLTLGNGNNLVCD